MNRIKLTTDRIRPSSREESIASEVDDLTIIAEFDYPSDEEMPSYHITSPYEIVGLSLTNGSRHGGGFHDYGYDHPDATGGKIRRDIYNDSRDYVDFDEFSRAKFRKDNSKSLGIQASAIYNSRATSPLTEAELIDLDLISQEENSLIREALLEDKSTNTDDAIKVATRNVTTSTDHYDTQFWEDIYKDKPILKAAGTQTIRATNNAAVQVVLDKDSKEIVIKDLESSQVETRQWQNLSEVVQIENDKLNDMLESMRREMKDLRNSLSESKLEQNLAEKIQLENEELKKIIDDMKTEISILRSHPEKVRNLEEERNKSDKMLAEMESRLKNVINDSEDDLKFVRSKLEQALTDLDEKDVNAKDMAAQLKDYKTRQSNLERVIEDLKYRLKNADIKSAALYGGFDMPDEKRNFNLLNNSNEDYGDLLRKYNNLRKIASKLQTSVSSLKAKFGLTNKKCRIKDELLRRLIDIRETEIPAHLKIEIEENLRDDDHYRPLSPLTLTNIIRLEHDLFNNLYEKIPYFGHVDETPLDEKSLGSGNYVNGDILKDLVYEVPKSETPTKRSQNMVPVKDDLFKHIGQRQTKISHFSPATVHSKSKRQNENFLIRPKLADHSTRRYSRTLPRSSTVVPPPQNFRIEDILDNKRFLFRWEPPQTLQPSIIGYELLVNGSKKDFIPGATTSKHSLNFVTSDVFPVTFELSSVRSDGNSTPAKIVIHGLQKITNNNDSVSLKLGYKTNALSAKSLNINENKNMLVAFYDYTPTGAILTKDGVAYSELGFKTGNIIETFGEALPNGYIFGKVSDNPQVGLIPLSFLEKISR